MRNTEAPWAERVSRRSLIGILAPHSGKGHDLRGHHIEPRPLREVSTWLVREISSNNHLVQTRVSQALDPFLQGIYAQPSTQRTKKVICLCVQVVLWSASVIINPLPDWFSVADWITSQMFHILFPSFLCLLRSLTPRGDACWVFSSDHACVSVTTWLNSFWITPTLFCNILSVVIVQPQWGPFALLRKMSSWVQDSWNYLPKIERDQIITVSSGCSNSPIFLSIRDKQVQHRAANIGKIGLLIFY